MSNMDPKTIQAAQAKQTLGTLLRDAEHGTSTIIRRWDHAVGVVVPIEDFLHYRALKDLLTPEELEMTRVGEG